MNLRFVPYFCILCVLLPHTIWAAPYTPSSDDVILERLPYSLSDIPATEIDRDDAILPLAEALALAENLLQKARETADPRLYGRIQAILRPWWSQEKPPLAVLKIRADILQKQHHFEGSLNDIDQILAANPEDAATLYMQASIYRVLGRYEEGLASCKRMQGITNTFSVHLCVESISYLNGEYDKSYQRLEALLQEPGRIRPSLIGYGYGLLGELAYAGGRYEKAEKHLKIAQTLGGKDPYIMSLLADLYLQLKDYEKVESLLQDEQNNDTLLLRLALARAAQKTKANPYADTFRLRLREAERRGSEVHLREAAWFYLDIEFDAEAALKRAQKNWQTQKEPLDSLLLLRAASAARVPEVADPVIKFLNKYQTEEIHLRQAILTLSQEESS